MPGFTKLVIDGHPVGVGHLNGANANYLASTIPPANDAPPSQCLLAGFANVEARVSFDVGLRRSMVIREHLVSYPITTQNEFMEALYWNSSTN